MKGDQELSAPAHPRWLLLSLEGDVDQAAQDHVDAMIGGLASAEFIEETVAMIAGLSRTARRLAETWAKEQELTSRRRWSRPPSGTDRWTSTSSRPRPAGP